MIPFPNLPCYPYIRLEKSSFDFTLGVWGGATKTITITADDATIGNVTTGNIKEENKKTFSQPQLPNTGDSNSESVTIFGVGMLLGILALIAGKLKKDE